MIRRVGRYLRSHVVVVAVVVAIAAAERQAPAREPASKAAAILTWDVAKREHYIAALDSFFLSRTVKAGSRAHVLDQGRALAAFESGGPRAGYFDRFMTAQRVRGVLVLQDGKIRLERFVSPHSPTTRWNSFSIAKSVTSTLVGAGGRHQEPRRCCHELH